MDVLHKLGDSTLDKAVEYEVQKRKLEIIFDFIFSTYIKLDEELLRADIETDICLTDADSPSAHSLMVNERLQNPKNYYTEKKT